MLKFLRTMFNNHRVREANVDHEVDTPCTANDCRQRDEERLEASLARQTKMWQEAMPVRDAYQEIVGDDREIRRHLVELERNVIHRRRT